MTQDYNKDDLIKALVTKYKIVIPTARTPTRNTQAEMKIGKTKFIFNKITVAELGYPKDVCMYISDDVKQIVIAATKKSNISIPFCNINKSGCAAIYNRGLAHTIQDFLHWDTNAVYTIPAVACFDGEIMLFDLERAFIRKRGKPIPNYAPMQEKDVLKYYPKVSEFVQSYQQLALAEKNAEEKSDNSPVHASFHYVDADTENTVTQQVASM